MPEPRQYRCANGNRALLQFHDGFKYKNIFPYFVWRGQTPPRTKLIGGSVKWHSKETAVYCEFRTRLSRFPRRQSSHCPAQPFWNAEGNWKRRWDFTFNRVLKGDWAPVLLKARKVLSQVQGRYWNRRNCWEMALCWEGNLKRTCSIHQHYAFGVNDITTWYPGRIRTLWIYSWGKLLHLRNCMMWKPLERAGILYVTNSTAAVIEAVTKWTCLSSLQLPPHIYQCVHPCLLQSKLPSRSWTPSIPLPETGGTGIFFLLFLRKSLYHLRKKCNLWEDRANFLTFHLINGWVPICAGHTQQ